MPTSNIRNYCLVSRILYDCGHCMEYIVHEEECDPDAETCEFLEAHYNMHSSECPRCRYAYEHQTNFDEITIADLGMDEDAAWFHSNDTVLYLPHTMIEERRALFRLLMAAEKEAQEADQQARRLRARLRDAYLLDHLATALEYVVGQRGEQQCNICFGEYRHGDEACRLLCGHEFGFGCIVKWLIERGTCPQCRRVYL